MNGTFGWPEGIAANAPTPAYPMAALGVRLEGKPLENLTLHAAVFDGNPDSVDQFGLSLNPYGIGWRLSGNEGTFFIAELVVVNPARLPIFPSSRRFQQPRQPL